MSVPACLAWFLLFCGRILVNGQILPEVVACNGFAREWGVCPSLPPCFQPVHCKFGEWEDWYYGGGCTGICFRSRQVKEFSDDYGRACSGPMETTKDCTNHPNYVSSCYNGADQGYLFGESQCDWQDWSQWSDCSRECGGGEKGRDRHIAKTPKYGGSPCMPKDTDEVKPCHTKPCMACVDGQWAAWQPWQACSVTCGSGLQWRQRDYAVQANQCGRPATGSHREFKPCHGVFAEDDPLCPVSVSQERCMLGDWEDWNICEAQCDIGRRARRRPFLMDDVKHYTKDLEHQIFALQAGSEHIDQQKNTLMLNITAMHRQIERLQDELTTKRNDFNKELAKEDRLRNNVSKADWQQKQLELTIARLRQDKEAMMAQVKQMKPATVDMALNVGSPDQGTNMLIVGVLTFALGVLCACCANGAIRKRRHRTAALSDDLPDTASVTDGPANMKDVEQPWRPVSSASPAASDGENGRDGFE